MTRKSDQTLIFQTLLSDHKGNVLAALAEACARLEYAYRNVSWAYARRMSPATEGKIDDVPNPITDDWVSTGKAAE